MVLRQGLTLAAAGAGVGLVGALIVSHLMAGLLYGVSPYDLSTFAGVTAVLTAVAIAASYVPALRAMRLDPITTLRMTFGTARDLSSQVVAIPMTSFGMLMNSPHSEFQRISPQKRSRVQECQ